MAQANSISDLQAVDFAIGGVIVGAYEGLADDKPEAFCRFLKRPAKSKIFRCQNEDPNSLMRRIASHSNESRGNVDLPIVAYYRAPGVMGDMNQKPQCLDVERYLDDNLRGLQMSTIPVTLSYTLLWLAWDKPTLDKMALAWFCYIAQRRRRNCRFVVPYMLEGEILEIPSTIWNVTEIQGDNASGDSSLGRLWGCRSIVEVNTQVIYGREVEPLNEIKVIGSIRLLEYLEQRHA